ncbi:Hint domain-containing protein [Roseomonas elaeocarpi]|uniref:Hint domain-containing protein n=1 Tax=Roseomonas elaeocarpi TaxID=907779 RepID=A0ABV6JZ97_9PROT
MNGSNVDFQSLTYGYEQSSAYKFGTLDYYDRVTPADGNGLNFHVYHLPPQPDGQYSQFTVTMTEPSTSTVDIWEHQPSAPDWPGNHSTGYISYHSGDAFVVNAYQGTALFQYLFTNAPIGDGAVTVYPNNSAQAGTFTPPCYAAGSHILTSRGGVAVEALREGDLVVTHDGALRPVTWIGHRRVDPARMPRPEDACPTRIRAHAFGEGLPHRDLRLSPNHSVFVDGALVPIRHLVNGVTILREPALPVTYYHVELPEHAILLAEGLPAESYLDTGNRFAFGSGGPVVSLHPLSAQDLWEARACAPKLDSGPGLDALRRKLIARAEELGFASTSDPDTRLVLDGTEIAPAWQDRDVIVFNLPAGCWHDIQLRSRAEVSAWIHGNADDRRLGLALEQLVLRGPHAEMVIGAHADELCIGFHGPEANDGYRWRWTDGEARLPTGPFTLFPAGCQLTIRLRTGMTYWLAGTANMPEEDRQRQAV